MSEVKTMFLCYRGLSYQVQSFPFVQTNKTIKYRGNSYQTDSTTFLQYPTQKQLKYRGICYTM
ncbi:hypothetical protein C7H19_09245 [Aphanothece hegewaldii CCALA 016]|uniref:DUF4278 domain-containing protein n=1 Tax=Aphanothece hegewaldii CCALA 016 TaxID=2107694 RepID=A0A2T1LZB2_9CHRO|nr:DUF4278 domain-containing protein [Aphanothece hegewaldii]PSF37723.1 hypothetical protein C7H19_09245 [Aphanothece hegewaldii CCALA 016]